MCLCPWRFPLLLSMFLAVYGALVPGVRITNQTVSFCRELKIDIAQGCLNRFQIGDEPLAEVEGPHFKVLPPFEFLENEGKMKIVDLKNFTHQINCKVDKFRNSEEINNYQLTPCHKQDGAPNAATVLQGFELSLLMTLLIGIFR